MTIIEAADFGVTPDDDTNLLALHRALEACRARNDEPTTLRFATDTYFFDPFFAVERVCWPSNNDGGLRRIAFLLEDFTNLTIDGGGSTFYFEGEIIPFVIDRSHGVTIKDLSIDWIEPVTLTGKIVSVSDGLVTLATDPFGGFCIGADGSLTISTHDYKTLLAGYIEIDSATKAPAYGTSDVWLSGEPDGWENSFEKIEEHRLRFRHPSIAPKVGNHLVFLRGDRRYPGIFLSESGDTQIVDVTVYQAPAMALIAQRCTNIIIERLRVELRPGADHLVSATADATHFVGCRGTIQLIDCLFENQLDDPANIHGTYGYVFEKLAPNELLLQRKHEQQKGVPFAGSGDHLRFYTPDTMESIADASVQSVREINKDYFSLTLTEPLPDSVDNGIVVENLSWTPDVEIRGCVARRNRARGFLISTPGKVLVEGCTLSPGGAGILIAGESKYWYESGAVRDVTIRGNHFDHCNIGCWGIAAIDITPHIPRLDARTEPFHRNIRIENNTFTTFQNALIAAWSVDGLTVRGNRIVRTTEQAAFGKQTEAIMLRGCENVEIEDAFSEV